MQILAQGLLFSKPIPMNEYEIRFLISAGREQKSKEKL